MRHNLVTIFRRFKRRPLTNSINLLGLAIGMLAVLIIATYCYNEFTTDSHHVNGDNVFLVLSEREQTSGIIPALHTPGILKDQIDLQIPQIAKTVRVSGTWNPPIFQAEGHDPVPSQLIFADPGFFDLFSYSVIAGDIKTALDNPNSLVLMASEAERLFGTKQAIGKMVTIDNQYPMIVTAVIDNARHNTCLSFKAIAPVSSMNNLQPEEEQFTSWWHVNFQTFVLIENTDRLTDIETSITQLFPVNPYHNEKMTASLFPLRDIYFSGLFISHKDHLHFGNINNIIVLLLVAVLVLCMAVSNYLNIASAHRMDRLKNIGVQKIIGAGKKHIFWNTTFEAIITFVFSFLIAWAILPIISPLILNYTGIAFKTGYFSSLIFMAISLFVTIILGFMSAVLPALRLSTSNPVLNLKKLQFAKTNKSVSQRILVVSQFIVAIVLIAFTLLIHKQIKFGSKELGFNQENIVIIKITDQLHNKTDILKQYLSQQPIVQKSSFSRFYPGKDFSSWRTQLLENGEEKTVTFNNFHADANFFDLMETKLISGRYYSNDLSSDKNKVVVNETFLKKYGITNPIGTTFYDGKNEIIGVVKDFHYKPVNEPIEPLAIICHKWASTCMVKLATNNYNIIHPFLKNIKKKCAELSPAFPVEIQFMDSAVENMYQQEKQFRRTFTLFAGCAMFICSLGILALSLFAAQQRTKEIGIRKVVGATSLEIVQLLLSGFIKWVVVAFVIACPIAWYMMNKWLQNFAYKTEISWWMFALTGGIALLIALLTVSWQAIQVAMANPVRSLRYE